MKINVKKVNAVLTLLCIAFAIDHMIFMGFELIRNEQVPVLSKMPMVLFFVLVGLHAALSMGIFFLGNTEAGVKYPKKNAQTVEQRIAAIAFVICIVFHVFDIKYFHIGGSKTLFITEFPLVIAFCSHVQSSVERAFITLGIENKVLPIIIKLINFAAAIFATYGLVRFCFF